MSKWIKIRDGHWKTVPDDYNAPEETPPPPKLPGIPHIISRPPWAHSEPAIQANDPKVAMAATDDFLDDRAKWTRPGGKWANWEKGRKIEWAKNKPAWRKKHPVKGGS